MSRILHSSSILFALAMAVCAGMSPLSCASESDSNEPSPPAGDASATSDASGADASFVLPDVSTVPDGTGAGSALDGSIVFESSATLESGTTLEGASSSPETSTPRDVLLDTSSSPDSSVDSAPQVSSEDAGHTDAAPPRDASLVEASVAVIPPPTIPVEAGQRDAPTPILRHYACVSGCFNNDCDGLYDFCTADYGRCKPVPCVSDEDCCGIVECDILTCPVPPAPHSVYFGCEQGKCRRLGAATYSGACKPLKFQDPRPQCP